MYVTQNELAHIFMFFSSVSLIAELFLARKLYKDKKHIEYLSLIFTVFLTTSLSFFAYGLMEQTYVLMSINFTAIAACIFSLSLVFYYKKYPPLDPYTNLPGITAEDIIENLPEHIYWRSKDGICLGCNKHQYVDLGCKDKSEYIGKTPYDFYLKDQADKVAVIDMEVIRTNMDKIAEEYGFNVGKPVLCLSHKTPLKNKQDDTLGILGISIDITIAKQKELEEKDFLENIIALMPGVHVYWVDKNCVYMGCNDLQAKSAGLLSRKDIVGKRSKDLPSNYKTNLPEIVERNNLDIMASGLARTLEEEITYPDGTRKSFLSNKVPLRDKNNEVTGLLGISIDITHLKQVEEALRIAEDANKLKIDFIHNMEHDLRTPFNGVYALTRVLAERETDPLKKDYLQKISQAGKELLDYCNAILDFSNIETENAAIRHKRFDLKELLNNIITMQGATVTHKNLKLALDYPDTIPHILIGDDVRVQRIVLNLTSNAIKFTEVGEVSIRVSLVRENPEKREVILKIIVEDTGIGISEDKKDLIFEKFTRLTPSNKGKYKGMGLGLYIVKQFITDLNADIDLISTEGKGTAFICTIPFKLPHEDII